MSASIERAVMDPSAPLCEPETIRTLVHKRFPENVLLTGIRACADDHFVCTGRIPTAHPLFNDAPRVPQHDMLFYTELSRQASIALTHAYFNASLEDVFIFEGSAAALTNAAGRVSPTAETVELDIKVTETVRRRNTVSRAVADYAASIGGDLVFAGTGTWNIQPAALFRRLRRGTVERSSVPAVQGAARGDSTSAGNVVISALERRGDAVSTSLIVDCTHRYFFDHPCDHVPGMLLLDGCAQMALGACAGAGLVPAEGDRSHRMVIVAYEVNFTQFVEYDLPTTLIARPISEGIAGVSVTPTMEIAIVQQDEVTGTVRMRVGLPG
jgi:hypothetical protein